MAQLGNIEHTKQQNYRLCKYSAVMHNVFVLHLVTVLYFAQIPDSKDHHFVLLYAADLVGQAGKTSTHNSLMTPSAPVCTALVSFHGNSLSVMDI